MQLTYFPRNWLNEAKNLCSIKDIQEFGFDTLEEEIGLLEKELSQDYQEIGFCHNDLQYGNIMMDEETRLITIIVSSLLGFNETVSLSLTLLVVLKVLHFLYHFFFSFLPRDSTCDL